MELCSWRYDIGVGRVWDGMGWNVCKEKEKENENEKCCVVEAGGLPEGEMWR